nr:hypothetical protein [Tanacetum cinerariifolium]
MNIPQNNLISDFKNSSHLCSADQLRFAGEIKNTPHILYTYYQLLTRVFPRVDIPFKYPTENAKTYEIVSSFSMVINMIVL